jgi:2-keto-3-deoxy-L-rhamnonate aldolase RhmA
MAHGFITSPNPDPRSPEKAAERARRIKREAEILAQAERDIDAGLGIEDDEMEAWLDEIDRTKPIDEPSPEPARHF